GAPPIDARAPLPALLLAAPPPPQASAAEQRQDCMSAIAGVRWQLMAEHMQSKLRSMPNLSAPERKAWEEDIAVVRAAQQGDAKTMPQSPDPRNPARYMTRLTPQDQMAMIQEQSARSHAIIADCNGRTSAATGAPDRDAAR